jgi:hypothetical protein
MKTTNNLVFSRPKSERYFIDYADKVGLVIIVGLYLAGIIDGIAIQNALGWFGTLPFILLIIFLYNPVFRRFAYRISIDTEKNEYTFFMFRKKGAFAVKQENLTKIYVNFFITFYFEGKKIIYTGIDDEKLIAALKSQRQISWGPFWNLTCKIRKEH